MESATVIHQIETQALSMGLISSPPSHTSTMKRHTPSTEKTSVPQKRMHNESGYDAISFGDIPRQVAVRDARMPKPLDESADMMPIQLMPGNASQGFDQLPIASETAGVTIRMDSEQGAARTPRQRDAHASGTQVQTRTQDVVQCMMAVQIEVAESAGPPSAPTLASDDPLADDPRPSKSYHISSIKIVGRPPKLFGNSMGDHTTAYSVHQKGIMMALQGKTLAEANEILIGQYNESLKLPGMSEEVIKRSGRAARLLELQTQFGEYEGKLLKAIEDQSPKAVLLLQRMIGKYLEFREEIPFSAMNIAEISFGLAGKGKAEAGYVDVLMRNETGALAAKPNVLQQAILGLFDTQGLAIMISEPNNEVRELVLPGIDTASRAAKNLDVVLDQHLQTIMISFPRSFQDSKLENKPAVREQLIKDQIGPKIKGRIKKEKKRIDQSIYATENRITNLTGLEYQEAQKRRPPIPKNKKKDPTYVRPQYTATFLEMQAEVDDENDYLKTLRSESAYLKEFEKSEFLKDVKEDSIDMTEEERSNKLNLRSQRSAAKKLRKKEAENSELAERNESIATELILDEGGSLINIASAGRTESPFASAEGMGAHSTAWVVHVDELRAKLRGKSIEHAILEMHAMVIENKDKRKKMESLDLKIDDKHVEKLDKAEKNLDFYKGLEKKDPSLMVTELQSYINATLTYINFIPGSTFRSANTAGRGEGASRTVLLEYESDKILEDVKLITEDPSLNSRAKQKAAEDLAESTYDEVKQSIDGLLDLPKDMNSKVLKELKINHMKSIAVAYPKSFELYHNPQSLTSALTKRVRTRKKDEL
jgi:hypothetical protein